MCSKILRIERRFIMQFRVDGHDTTSVKGLRDTFQKSQKPQKFEQIAKWQIELRSTTSPRRKYQLETLIYGKPLVTKGMTRTVNGHQVTQSTNQPLSPAEIEKTLKRKDLDKDTRLTYELELKRQQQGGHLTVEQGQQWIDIQEREAKKFQGNIEGYMDQIQNGNLKF